jgi:hypothetical protein
LINDSGSEDSRSFPSRKKYVAKGRVCLFEPFFGGEVREYVVNFLSLQG